MDEKRTIGTSKLLRRHTDRRTFQRIAPPAPFLSQLIIGSQRLGPTGDPARAYMLGTRVAERRLPPGYRTTQTV